MQKKNLHLSLTCAACALLMNGVGLTATQLAAQEMRELSTDRPDTTESPFSVDKGHIQAELELVSYGRDKVSGVTTTTIGSSANVKYGLTQSADLQVVVGFLRSKETGNDTISGVDDITVRLKYNLWGQYGDGQATAFALMPFVTLPTHSKKLDSVMGDDTTAFGLIAPLSFSLPGGWDSAVMAEIDIYRNAADDGWTHALMLTWTAAHSITEKSAGFVELVSISPAERGSEAEAFFDAGVTYAVSDTLQLDAGTNIGLTKASEDLRLFSGASFKF
jgi:Putative MetA-pathway of phenol degradation